jgi:hypothetical protein
MVDVAVGSAMVRYDWLVPGTLERASLPQVNYDQSELDADMKSRKRGNVLVSVIDMVSDAAARLRERGLPG